MNKWALGVSIVALVVALLAARYSIGIQSYMASGAVQVHPRDLAMALDVVTTEYADFVFNFEGKQCTLRFKERHAPEISDLPFE